MLVLAALLGILLSAPGAANAAAPRIVIVSGSSLPRPVVITDWKRIFAVVAEISPAQALPRSELASRPRLRLSLFWGPRWNAYLAGGGSASALRPRQADQQGSYYPAAGGRPAAVDLPWAGRWPRVVPATAVRILVRFGVPARLALPVDPWAPLRRVLALPRLEPGAACPVSAVDTSVDWNTADIFGGSGIGPGPVYPGLGETPLLDTPPDTQAGGPWHGQKVFWYVLPSYAGPVLIRGRRLDGPEWMRFGSGKAPDAELRIAEGETVYWNGRPEGSRGWPSTVRARAAGCYGVQVDGTSFSRIVVFQVTLSD
jgi:hypothetical protein